jgi:electron transfer flavoprotein beta subunit
MLNIITCFKWVIDEADIKADAATRKLLFGRAGYKISAYDRHAIEEAVRFQEQHGASVAAVTVAPPSAKKCLKDALSRGPDSACFVNDPSFLDLDPSQTSSILAAAVRGRIKFDLIICGEGSDDLYAQQVGPALAERLGIPCATCVSKLTYAEDEKHIIAERRLDDGMETVLVPLPALVSVLPGINTPRIPTLKEVLGAAKKEIFNVALEELGDIPGPYLKTVEVVAAAMDRRGIRFSADEEGVRSAVNALFKEGVLSQGVL